MRGERNFLYNFRLFTVPYFNASKTEESTKCPWVGVVEGTAGGKNRDRWGDCNSFTLSRIQRAWPNFDTPADQVN